MVVVIEKCIIPNLLRNRKSALLTYREAHKLSIKLPCYPVNIYAKDDNHLTCMDGRYPKKYICARRNRQVLFFEYY